MDAHKLFAFAGAKERNLRNSVSAAANSPARKLLQKQADRAARVAVWWRASRAASAAAEKAANHVVTKASILEIQDKAEVLNNTIYPYKD